MSYKEIYIMGKNKIKKETEWGDFNTTERGFKKSLDIKNIISSVVIDEASRVVRIKMFGCEIHTNLNKVLYLKDIDLKGDKFNYPDYAVFNVTDLRTGKTHFEKTSMWSQDIDEANENHVVEDDIKAGAIEKGSAKVEIKTNHYENKHGVDFMDFLQNEIFTAEEMKVIAKFNMLKYMQRAGKKEGESIAKDVNKAQSYQVIYAENDTAYNGKYISGDVASIVADFEKYKK